MKAFFAVLSLLIFIQLMAGGQETAAVIPFGDYASAIDRYTTDRLRHNSDPAPLAKLLVVLNNDRELAQFPRTKATTSSVLQELATLAAIQVAFGKQEALDRENRLATGSVFPSGTPGKRQKPPVSNSQTQQQNKRVSDFFAQEAARRKNIAASLKLLEEQRATAEGQRFSLATNNAFLVALQGGPIPVEKPGREMSFEALSAEPGGFLGYVEQLGETNAPAAEGTIQLQTSRRSDRTKTVFVRGYDKPVSLGESLRLRVTEGTTKIIGGVTVAEYVVVP